jgi:hypothetical protein
MRKLPSKPERTITSRLPTIYPECGVDEPALEGAQTGLQVAVAIKPEGEGERLTVRGETSQASSSDVDDFVGRLR